MSSCLFRRTSAHAPVPWSTAPKVRADRVRLRTGPAEVPAGPAQPRPTATRPAAPGGSPSAERPTGGQSGRGGHGAAESAFGAHAESPDQAMVGPNSEGDIY